MVTSGNGRYLFIKIYTRDWWCDDNSKSILAAIINNGLTMLMVWCDEPKKEMRMGVWRRERGGDREGREVSLLDNGCAGGATTHNVQEERKEVGVM